MNAIPKTFLLPMNMEADVLQYGSQHLRDHVEKQLKAFGVKAILDLKLDVLIY